MKIVLLYHHEDENYANDLKKSLKALKRKIPDLVLWSQSEIKVGEDKDLELTKAIDTTKKLICLLSPDFIADDYLLNNVRGFVGKEDTHLIPISIRNSNYLYIDFLEKKQILPRNGISIKKSDDSDQAWTDIISEIANLLNASPEPTSTLIKEEKKIYYKSSEYKVLQKTIKRLKKIISLTEDEEEKEELYEELVEEKKKLKAFKEGVISLANTFQQVDMDTNIEKAQQLFNDGKFKELRTTLDIDVVNLEQQILQDKLKKNASIFLVYAQATAIDYSVNDRFEQAKIYFEKSLTAYKNEVNLFAYAKFLYTHNQTNEVQALYEEALTLYRKLSKDNPKDYLSYIAAILNNLGNLQSDKKALKQAKQSYKEALTIKRQLLKEDRATYLPDVTIILNNLGNLYFVQSNLIAAEQSHREALNIRRELAQNNSESYLTNVATTLNNLGNVLKNKKEIAQAKQSYEEALKIYQQLAQDEPRTYLPHVASVLNNLGVLQRTQNQIEEALSIRRKLTLGNRKKYLPEVAVTLNNLGLIQSIKKDWQQAEQSYQEALIIYEQLMIYSPMIYLPNIANTLNDLGNLQVVQKKLNEAEQCYTKALDLRQELAITNPSVYLPDVAQTLNSLGALLYEKKDLASARQYFEKALSIRKQFVTQYDKASTINIAQTLYNLGEIYIRLKDRLKAVAVMEEALVILLPLAIQAPSIKPYVDKITQFLNKWRK